MFSGGVALAAALPSTELINRDSVQSALQTMQQLRAGILMGQVMQGPISPVETGNESSTLPAGGVQLRISRLNGKSVETVVTDSQSRYEIALPRRALPCDPSSPALRLNGGERSAVRSTDPVWP